MPRRPRYIIPEVPLHVIQRGNNRAPTFESTTELTRFRQLLVDAARKFGCEIHAYVLMTNHFHLLLTPATSRSVASMMQAIGRRYVPWVNARRNRTGTLWEGRFKSSIIDSERYLMTCARYIELNPVRAGMVSTPRLYRWSSYRHNAHGEDDDAITPHDTFSALGSTPSERHTAYRALFRSPANEALLEDIRRGIRTGGVVGGDTFRTSVEHRLARPMTRLKHGGDRRSPLFRATHLDAAAARSRSLTP